MAEIVKTALNRRDLSLVTDMAGGIALVVILFGALFLPTLF